MPSPHLAEQQLVQTALIGALERVEAESQQRLERVQRLEAESQQRLERVQRLEAEVARLTGSIGGLEADSQQRLDLVRRLEAQINELNARLQSTEADSKQRLATLREYASQNIALKRLLADRDRRRRDADSSGLAEGLDGPGDAESPAPVERPATAPAARAAERARDVVTMIRPPQSTPGIDFHELWRFRHLFTMLVWRNVRVEFDATRLGSLWAVARPLVFAVVFAFFRGLSNAQTAVEIPYLLYVYSGLLLWTYFTDAASNSAAAIRTDSALVTKIYYPRLLTPLVPIISGLVTLLLGIIPLVPMMIWYEVHPGWQILLLPAIVLLCSLLALGIGTLVSSVSIENRDWERVFIFGLSIALWLSPVIYATGMLPAQYHLLFTLNPIVGILLGFRATLFDGFPMPSWELAYSSICAAVILVVGVYRFRQTEASLADRL